jgi:hypothetical protein
MGDWDFEDTTTTTTEAAKKPPAGRKHKDPVLDDELKNLTIEYKKRIQKAEDDNKEAWQKIKELESAIHTPADLDIDGFQKWIKQQNKEDHTEKMLITYVKDRSMYFLLSQFRSLYQKYEKSKTP